MVNLPFSGHTNPTLELSKVFISLGHQVTYVHSSEWREKVELTGARFVPYDDYPSTLSNFQKEIKSWGSAYKTIKRIGANYDCLIYEILFLPGKALADELGIPSFRLFSTFTLNEKVLKDFGKTGGWYMTSIFRYNFLYTIVSKILKKKFNLRYESITREIVDNAPKLNFTYTIRDFQIYEDDFDNHKYRYVGPSMGDRGESEFDFSQMEKPIIYVSLGTLFNTSIDFYRKCIEAFKEEPVSVIMSIGNIVKEDELGEIPENFYIYPFVPQLEVLKQASLFITHGGMNSVNESIYYGVPMLVIPVGNDQPTVAKQVENLQLGRYLKKNNRDSISLRTTAMDILQEPSYKDRLNEFQQKSQAAGGNKVIAHQILAELE